MATLTAPPLPSLSDYATVAISVQQTANSRLPEVDFDTLKFGRTFTDHMFVADYADGQWQDFRILPYGDLPISPANSALHYGQAIFEGLKAYRQNENSIAVFRPTANLARLNRSAQRMCMPEMPEELFMSGLLQLLSMDQEWVPGSEGSSLYIRPFMFATDGAVGIRPSDTYRFIIFTCPVGPYYTEPVRVKIETHASRASPGGTGYAKAAGNYAGALLPTRAAQEEGYHQLIWTDAVEHRYVEESGTMNLVFIIDGVVTTPPLTDTILKGVTRDSVLQIARDLAIPVSERQIEVAEIHAAAKNGMLEAAFGVGTAATFAPICLIGFDTEQIEIPTDSPLASAIRTTLEGIRAGTTPDLHQWMVPVR
jgi:branched-chain amino acid aminotransferase